MIQPMDPLSELQTRVEDSSQAAVAKELGISPQYLNDVLQKRRLIGKKILEALGLERSIVYVRANGKGAKRAGR
jgi:hypothetical protein